MLDPNQRHVLVTGASQGLGAECAVEFARAGFRVTITARREPGLIATTERMAHFGSGHGWRPCDLLNREARRALAEWLLAERGPIDVVVHAAGGSLGMRDIAADSQYWSHIWELNVGAVIDINSILIPAMRARRWGRVIHFSSRSAISLGGAGPYAAAKAYLNAYSTILGRSVAADGVIVSAIMPGAVVAPGNNWEKAATDHKENVARFLVDHQAIGRLGQPDDITPMVLFLASDGAKFAAGSVIPIDGGSF